MNVIYNGGEGVLTNCTWELSEIKCEPHVEVLVKGNWEGYEGQETYTYSMENWAKMYPLFCTLEAFFAGKDKVVNEFGSMRVVGEEEYTLRMDGFCLPCITNPESLEALERFDDFHGEVDMIDSIECYHIDENARKRKLTLKYEL